MAVCHQHARHQLFLSVFPGAVPDQALFVGEFFVQKEGVGPVEAGFGGLGHQGLQCELPEGMLGRLRGPFVSTIEGLPPRAERAKVSA